MSNIVEADYKVVIDDDLPTLVARIKTAEATVYRVTLAGVIEIGKCLEAAKEKVKHGEWEEWCTENLGYSQRQAQRFMKIADTYGNENSIFGKSDTLSDLSISKAYSLLSIPEDEVESFIENNDVEGMTVKELKEKIKRLESEKDEQGTEMEKEILQLQEQMERKNGEMKRLADEMEQKNGEMKRLADEMEQKNSEAEHLARELVDLKSQTADPEEITKLEEKLQKAKNREKELKEKLELEKDARDQEIQKALEKERDKLKTEAETAASEQIESTRRDNEAMAQQIRELEAKIDNISNESLMLFKLKVDQLQKIYQECREAAAETPDPDKTKSALLQIVDALVGREE